MDYDKAALDAHQKHGGKLTIQLRDQSPMTADKLSTYYTPGVAAVSRHLAEHPEDAHIHTWTHNLVAVISDGSAVLGLGNIGPNGALPVMEGKALLFKQCADIDSVPIVLDVHTPDEIVETIAAIAPSFGAINLEDIAAPQCFEIEARLKARLQIPVFHDDQHGTAVVVLAGLINAMKVVSKNLADTKIVIVGAGAAGTAITKLLHQYAGPQIIAVDSKGIIGDSRADLNAEKQALLAYIDTAQSGSLSDALHNADIFIGVSQPGLLTAELVGRMADRPVIFALANPIPEIMPGVALAAGAAVVATGRSDFPNQVNNAIAFPGIFRGALDHRVRQITDDHKVAAAETIAKLIPEPAAELIIPSVFDERLVPAVSDVIR